MSDTILKIKINNNNPVELLELTKSMMSLASQYNRFVENNADYTLERKSKLMVREVRAGCIEFDLVEFISASIIPFAENTNTIISFAKSLKSAFNFFVKGEGEEPKLNVADLKDMSNIMSMTANDTGSNLNFSTVVNGDVNLVLNIDSTNANAFQNIAKRRIEEMLGGEDVDTKKNVLFVWDQARKPNKKGKGKNNKGNRGNKGVISEISQKSMNVFFENDSIEEAMLNTDSNLFKIGFVVDVKPQEVRGSIVAYKITKVHQKFKLE